MTSHSRSFSEIVRGTLARARGQFNEQGYINKETKETLKQIGYEPTAIEHMWLNNYLSEHNA